MGDGVVSKSILIIVVGAAVLLIVAGYFWDNQAVSFWWSSFASVALGVVCYIVNIILIHHYIAKRTPELLDIEEEVAGKKAWEFTAGLGIVPRWVSYIGLVSISCFMAAVALALWKIVT